MTGKRLAEAGKRLQATKRDLQRELKRLEGVGRVLDIRQTVLLPGLLLLVAFVVSFGAAAFRWPWPLILVLAALLPMCGALVVFVQRLYDVNRLTLLLTPQVQIDIQFDPKWHTGADHKITLSVLLARGGSLHHLQTLLYVPDSFRSSARFPRKLQRPADDALMPNYHTIPSKEWPVLKRDIPFVYDYDRLRVEIPGSYKVYYRVTTEEYTSAYRHIDIHVT